MPKQIFYRYRFVIHLPTLDNDGNKIAPSLIQKAFGDLRRHFGGYTTSSYAGYPSYTGFYSGPDGKSYTDYIYIIYVDVEDSEKVNKATEFFQRFRAKYMTLFHQSELYIIYYPVTKI